MKVPFIKYIRNKYFKYILFGVIFIVTTFFLCSNNITVFLNENRTLKNQSVTINELEREIESNKTKIRQLKSERDSLEKFAREQYYFHAPGEDVYIVSR